MRPLFPSDRHALASHLAWRGLDPETDLVVVGPRSGEDVVRIEDIEGSDRRARPEPRARPVRRRELRDRAGPAGRAADGRCPRGRRDRRLAARACGRQRAARPPRRRRRLRRVVHVQVPQRRPGLGRVDLHPRAPSRAGRRRAAPRRLVGRGARPPVRPGGAVRAGRRCRRLEDVDLAALHHGAAGGVARDLRRGRRAGPARALDPPDRLPRAAAPRPAWRS